MRGLHECVWRWLQGCPHIRDMYFQYARAGAGDTVLLPETGAEDAELKRFIDGACERRYTFSLLRYDALSDAPNDETNLRTLEQAELVAAWIETQAALRAFPTLPEGCLPFALTGLTGDAAAYTTSEGLRSRYLFRFAIDYLKTK